jgi:DNA-directed RNA polymerase subunit RPC12/RpoP
MVSELYRLTQQGAGDKTFVDFEGAIVNRCRQMGQWAITAGLAAHPLANADREYRCPHCGGRLRILRPEGPREIQSRLGPISYNRPYGTCDRCRR